MNFYMTNTSEFLFLQCFKQEECSFQPPSSVDVQPNDTIIMLVDGKIAGISSIANVKKEGEYITLSLHFNHTYKKENRLVVPKKFSLQLEHDLKTYCNNFSFPIKDEIGKRIYQFMNVDLDDIGFFLTEIDWLLEQAEKKEKKKAKQEHVVTTPYNINELSEHAKIQFFLKEIASIIECESFIANNDQNRMFLEQTLGNDSMEHIPDFALQKEVEKVIEYIDVIWFKDHLPFCAFEVEKSTSIYSGLLRLSDLAVSLPNQNLKLFIVAPEKRREKVFKELKRPIFQSIKLSNYCSFISFEELEKLYFKIKGLHGYIRDNVLDSISVSV